MDSLRYYLDTYPDARQKVISELGSGTLVGGGNIEITDTYDDNNEYQVVFMCSVDEGAPFSISLKRDDKTREMMHAQDCSGAGIITISLPVKMFPDASAVQVQVNSKSSPFIVIVQEVESINREKMYKIMVVSVAAFFSLAFLPMSANAAQNSTQV